MSHIVTENNFVVEIRCPLCDSPVQTMVPMEKYIDVQRVNGQIVKRMPCYLRPNNNYRQIILEVTDGEKLAKHVTFCCKTCYADLNTQSMQKLYQLDMQQFHREGMHEKHLKHFMRFRPTKCLGEEPLYE